jgi:hypothetical protein
MRGDAKETIIHRHNVAIRGRRCFTAEYVGEPLPVWSAAITFTDVICQERVEIAILSHINA